MAMGNKQDRRPRRLAARDLVAVGQDVYAAVVAGVMAARGAGRDPRPGAAADLRREGRRALRWLRRSLGFAEFHAQVEAQLRRPLRRLRHGPAS
jgi:hypothetical protein